MLDGATYTPKWNGNASKYLQGKLKVLKDFCIKPTESEMEHLKSLTTQAQIDSAIIAIINSRW